MFRVDEVCIFVVYLQDVGQHLPYQHRQGEQLAEDGVFAQLLGGGDVERQTDEKEQQPPLEAPDTREQGDEARHDEGDDDEHGTGNERLLDGLVDEVDIERHNGLGNVGQQVEEALNLGRHPAQTLFLEVVLVTDFLVVDMNLGLVVDIDFLLEQQGFQLAVLASGREFEDILMEPLVVEAHAAADEG